MLLTVGGFAQQKPVEKVYVNHNKKIYAKGYCSNKKNVGVWTIYYPNGLTQQTGEFKDGMKVGLWKFYHMNGKFHKQVVFKDGMETGSVTEYWDNGKVRLISHFNMKGQPVGKWTYYNYNGKLYKEFSH